MIDVIQRAEHANRIMTDEMVVEAFETIENDMVKLWMASTERDGDGRERIYRLLFAMRTFKAFFDGVLTEGQIHQHKLQELKRSGV